MLGMLMFQGVFAYMLEVVDCKEGTFNFTLEQPVVLSLKIEPNDQRSSEEERKERNALFNFFL